MNGNNPTALVLLASKQLWPNIHSIQHWSTSLKRVLIYYTNEPHESAGPAKKLVEFCEQHKGRKLKVDTFQGSGGTQDVIRQIGEWLKQYPGESWVINATGGTKLMFDGAASFRERVRVVYREITDKWYDLKRDMNGLLAPEEIHIPPEATDEIPVNDLIKIMWETAQLPVTRGVDAELLDLLRISEELAKSGDWCKAFIATGADIGDGKSGILFERYIASAMYCMGVRNLVRTVKQGPETGGQHTQEIDIVANHAARLLVVDCKLCNREEIKQKEVEKITSQLRQAAQTARQLGGLGGKVVLVRPNILLGSAEKELAAALQVEVIDHSSVSQLFARLANVAKVAALPNSLLDVDRLLSDPENVACAFPTSRRVRTIRRATDKGIILRDQLLKEWAAEFGQDWAAIDADGQYTLRYSGRASESQLRALFMTYTTEQLLTIRPSQKAQESGLQDSGSHLIELRPLRSKEKGFREFLKSRVGLPLIQE